MQGKAFVDSNVLLYLLSADQKKADIAEKVLERDFVVSVQVLNEVTNVARRKLGMSWDAIAEFIATIREICAIESLTIETHERAREIAERHRLSFYDGCIVASAMMSGCSILLSEDMQHGATFDNVLRIVNPFR